MGHAEAAVLAAFNVNPHLSRAFRASQNMQPKAPCNPALKAKEFEQGFKVESTRAWFEALGIKAGVRMP